MSSAPASELPVEAVATAARGIRHKLLRRPLFLASAAVLFVLVLMAIIPGPFASVFGHGDPRSCDLARSGLGSAPGHPFGYDIQGCDLYAQVIHGARPSITIGILVTLISVLIAVAVGSVAGYYGGVIDALLGRVIDVFYGFPFIVAAIVILTAIGVRNIWTVCAALAAFSWPTMTRVMRSSVIVARNAEYVRAARALGASDMRIMRRHILPNAFAPVLVLATLSVAGIIAGEAALTFLGVGLQAPTISWGVQLNTAQSYFYSSPHLLIYPSVFLSITVLAFVLLGDAVRDAFDPKAG